MLPFATEVIQYARMTVVTLTRPYATSFALYTDRALFYLPINVVKLGLLDQVVNEGNPSSSCMDPPSITPCTE